MHAEERKTALSVTLRLPILEGSRNMEYEYKWWKLRRWRAEGIILTIDWSALGGAVVVGEAANGEEGAALVGTPVTTISGDRRSTRAAPSSPLAASPTTTQPRADQSMVRIMPLRAIVSSSTTTTLFMFHFLPKWQPQRHSSAVFRHFRVHTVLLSIVNL